MGDCQIKSELLHSAQNTTTDNTQALHEQLRDLRDTMQNALNQADIDTLLHHVTDDVVFTTMNGDRVIGKTAVAFGHSRDDYQLSNGIDSFLGYGRATQPGHYDKYRKP